MDLFPLFLNLPVIVWAAVSDLRGLRIPNTLALISILLFLLTAPFVPQPELLARILAASLVFAAGFVLFALRFVGGGDVKMLSALMLFIPVYTLPMFGFLLSLSLLLSIAVLAASRAAIGTNSFGLIGLEARGKLPMALPIAVAATAHLLLILVFGQ